MNKNRQIAIVGSGVSGTVAAWLLKDTSDVTLFEADCRFGGHTHTAVVPEADGEVAVDTGFMVFNRPNYPLLSAMFDHLGIRSYPTDMSFAASFGRGEFEYAGTNLNTLFGQRGNLARPAFWKLLASIVRFNRAATKALQRPPNESMTLAGFLDQHGFDDAFRTAYLYPMAAAIWSCPQGQVAQFPAVSFLRFFANHGLIRLADRPQWHTVEGGSRSYLDRLTADLGARAVNNAEVVRVVRSAEAVTLVLADGSRAQFDDVVLACHSDQALALLDEPAPGERQLLSAIPYQSNRVVLHRDPSLMPRRRRVWSSWNYLSERSTKAAGETEQAVSVTYWMNSLQRLPTRNDYFVSLNPSREPDAGHVVAEYTYDHPVFDAGALQAQRSLHRLQGRSRTWFAGAWTGYGFHEDGMRSAVEVAAALGARVPWQTQIEASRALTLVPRLVDQAA